MLACRKGCRLIGFRELMELSVDSNLCQLASVRGYAVRVNFIHHALWKESKEVGKKISGPDPNCGTFCFAVMRGKPNK